MAEIALPRLSVSIALVVQSLLGLFMAAGAIAAATYRWQAKRPWLASLMALGMAAMIAISAVLVFRCTCLWAWIENAPPLVLTLIAVAGCLLAWHGFRQRLPERVLLLILAGLELLVLSIWVTGGNAVSVAFSGANASWVRVLDPALEHVLMLVFWRAVAVAICAVQVAYVWRWICAKSNDRGRIMPGVRLAALAAHAFLLFCMRHNVLEWARIPPDPQCGTIAAKTTSPDGTMELQLAPIAMFIHENGVVLWREKGEFWWHPIGTVGPRSLNERRSYFTWRDDWDAELHFVADGNQESSVFLVKGFHEIILLKRESAGEATTQQQPNSTGKPRDPT